MSRLVVLFSVPIVMLACGSADRPAPTGDSAGRAASMSAVAEAADSPDPQGSCELGAWRPCRRYYRDLEGQLQCPMDYQLCAEGGSQWLPCGKYYLDNDNIPVPR